jgi:segregation and condensation protein B
MLNDDILKALIEGIIYVAPEPVTLDAIVKVLEGEERERVKVKLDELVGEYELNMHGIQIRQVANGYKFSTKAEHHEVLRKYVKSLKPAVRLSKPALETLAVIAYRQPVTVPEIEEIRGVDSGGVIHTLMEKKLVVTSGRKSVVGRPILYRTSKDFLVHFGLKDVGELPSLKEFEELAKRALGSEWAGGDSPAEGGPPSASAAVGEAGAAGAAAISPTGASLPVGEETAPPESPAAADTTTVETGDTSATEDSPAARDQNGVTSAEATAPSEGPAEAPAPPEPVPLADGDTAATEVATTTRIESPATEPAAPSEETSTAAALEEPAAGESPASPEDHERKP